MNRTISRSDRRLIVVGCLAILAVPTLAPADVVIMKDGFTLHGKVRKETDSFTDAWSGETIAVGKIRGAFMVDDMVRWVFFSAPQVQDLDDKFIREGQVLLQRRMGPPRAPMPGPVQFESVSEFDDQWERVLKARGPGGKFDVKQRLSVLSPYFTRINGVEYSWAPHFLTTEIGNDLVVKLLKTHPETSDKPEAKPSLDKALKRFRFLIQAGMFPQAESELKSIEKTFADEKKPLEEARKNYTEFRAEALLDEIERARSGGRHRWAREALQGMPAEGLPAKVLAKVNTFKVNYETTQTQTKLAVTLLAEIARDIVSPDRKFLQDAAEAITSELHEDTIDRLEAFVTIAEQASKDKKAGKEPKQTSEELLSLAVSGWLLGKNSAEVKVAVAEKLWKTRVFLLDFLRSDEPAVRKTKLTDYLKGDPLAYDELAQLISLLPPPVPEGNISNQPTPLEYKAPSASRKNGTRYVVQPPPEYRHGRSYPVLIVLHHAGEKPESILRRASYQAARHGYLLVAPEWSDPFADSYAYTGTEQSAVTEALRDLKLHYNVDCDRVFLFGFGEGAVMAWDLGLSHPDLFAGVIPMNGVPRWSLGMWTWRNAQHLPFYVVCGEKAGNVPIEAKRLFDHWLPKGFPTLLVVYKGRGLEWFAGEWPFIYDWMSRKKRVAFPTQVGNRPFGISENESMMAVRPEDNRFYWLSTTAIMETHTKNSPAKSNKIVPAKFFGFVGAQNKINVTVLGLKNVTVWLGKGMVDFEKPVTVTYKGNRAGGFWSSGKNPIKPNLAVMLEDLYERCDRQRMYFYRIDIDNP